MDSALRFLIKNTSNIMFEFVLENLYEKNLNFVVTFGSLL